MKKIFFLVLGFIICGGVLTAQTLDEALLGDSFGSPSNALAAGSDSRDKRERIFQAANSRNNWISVLGGGFPYLPFCISIGANYERMLGSEISLGANIFWTRMIWFGTDAIEIDVPFRFYPWGKTFFLGAALGFYYSSWSGGEEPGDDLHTTGIGLAITPEIGWKIDVGKQGKLYLQTGIAQPFWFGKWYVKGYERYIYKEKTYSGFDPDSLFMGRIYFGMGYAF